jgi:hypothetical protein
MGKIGFILVTIYATPYNLLLQNVPCSDRDEMAKIARWFEHQNLEEAIKSYGTFVFNFGKGRL